MTIVSPMMPTRVLSGRNTAKVSVTPTVDADTNYESGDVVGGKITLANIARESGGSGAVVWAHVYSLVDIADSIPIRVILFNEDPTNSTFTDNAALAVDADDLDKIAGVINLNQRLDLGTPVMLHAAQPMVLPFSLPSDVSAAYAVAVAGGAINLASAADLTFVFGVEQD